MSYEINVAKDGKHYFATHERSLTDREPAAIAFKDFQKRFPIKQGFSVTITYNQTIGNSCYLDESGELKIYRID